MNNPLQFFRVQISDKFINSNTNKLHSCFYSRNVHMAGEYIIKVNLWLYIKIMTASCHQFTIGSLQLQSSWTIWSC